ncbi:hypothetical protein Dxin01_00847 [Deinococcus xinjiangensis]|uniref:Uncharacterized protein n=1 Tax=Deinococcus xinjiangensis TaxID=457454 RepID=A0ABP9V8U4_9DEIO
MTAIGLFYLGIGLFLIWWTGRSDARRATRAVGFCATSSGAAVLMCQLAVLIAGTPQTENPIGLLPPVAKVAEVIFVLIGMFVLWVMPIALRWDTVGAD